MNSFGMKEIYDVNIRINQPIEIGGIKYDINESILSFKTAELVQVDQRTSDKTAKGGYGNAPLVWWETDKSIAFKLDNGVLTPTSWAILSNSKLSEPKQKSVQYCEQIKAIEDDCYCFVDLKFVPNNTCRLGAQPNPYNEPLPMGRRPELMLKPLPPSKVKWLFCYDAETGKRIREFEVLENRIYFKESFREVMVDYTFDYLDRLMVIEVGNRLFNGFLRLTGKMSYKDEVTGEVKTAILELPKIKLSSNLSMRLGKDYQSSTVSDFYFTGYPDEEKRRELQTTANITFLDTELSGDYI